MTLQHPSARFATAGRRTCAIMTAGSAGVHLMMLSQSAFALAALPVALMAAVCLMCARDLWRDASLRTWCAVAVMNLGMIAAHWSIPGCGHNSVAAATQVTPSTLMVVATVVSVVEATIATVVMIVQTHRRAQRLFPRPNGPAMAVLHQLDAADQQRTAGETDMIAT